MGLKFDSSLKGDHVIRPSLCFDKGKGSKSERKSSTLNKAPKSRLASRPVSKAGYKKRKVKR